MLHTPLSGSARRCRTRRPSARLSLHTLEAREVPAAFTPGNLVVYRVGDGSVGLTGNGSAVFLDEYTPTGTKVQQIALPTLDPDGAGPQHQLIAGGLATAEGLMTRSGDGTLLAFAGYGRDIGGTTGLSGTSPAIVPRVVALVGPDGVADTTTTVTDASTGSGAPRGVATQDGTAIWISTQSDGVRYVAHGASTSTQINNSVLTMRYVSAIGGQLYYSANTGTSRVGTAGTGLPITGGQTFTNAPGLLSTTIAAASGGLNMPQSTINVASTAGFPSASVLNIAGITGTATYTGKTATSFTGVTGGTGTLTAGNAVATGSPYGFFFADLDPGMAGNDTLYVADDGGTTGVPGGLYKFSLVGGNWIGNGVVGSSADIFRGVAGVVSGGTVTLYVTRKGGSAAAGGGELVKVVDDTGYNANITATPASLATAVPNIAFRGIALVPNHAPATTDGTLTTAEDTAKDGTLTATDADNNALTFSVVSPPAHGTVLITNAVTGAYTYTPAAEFSGADSFTFKTTDGGDFSNVATVTVTVNAVNDAPVNTLPATFQTDEENSLNLAGIAVTDVDAGSADVRVTLSIPGGGVGTLRVTTGLTGGVTAAQVSNNNSTAVTMTAPLAAINATLANPIGLMYFPPLDFNGDFDLAMVTSDLGNTGGSAQTDEDHATISVRAINDTPQPSVPGSQTTAEDTPLVFSAARRISVTDPDAGSGLKLILTATNGTARLSGTAGLTVSGDGTAEVTAVGTPAALNAALTGLTFTPDQDFSGSATLKVFADDQGQTGFGGARSNFMIVGINVTAVNDPPLNNGPISPLNTLPVTEDIPFALAGDFSFVINDADAGTGDLSTTMTATHGTLTVTDVPGVTITGNGSIEVSLSGSLDDLNMALHDMLFNPDANYFGPANIHVVTTDNGNTGGPAETDTDNFAIDVSAVNDPPVAGDDTQSTRGNTPLNASVSATDAENDTLNYSVVSGPTHGTLALTAATGAYTYTPDAGYVGSESFTFNANDGTANSNTATVSITVLPTNQAPVAQDGSLTAAEDTPTAGTLVATDADGDPLAFSVVAQPIHGSVTITNPTTGAYTYTPAGDYNGPDSFTFQADDGTVDSNTATVSITVTPVNDAPVAAGGTLTTAEDTAQTGTLAATDVDENPLTYAVVAGPTHGTLTAFNGSTGAFTYAPAADYNGLDSFTFQPNDGTADGNTATVSITVTAVNDAPVFTPPGSAFTLALDTPNGTAVGTPLAGTDVDGDTLTFALTGDPSGGGFRIDPVTGQLSVRDTTLITGGSYTLAVEVRDPSNASGAGTVTVRTNLRPVLDTAGTPMLVNQPLPAGKAAYAFAGTPVADLLGFATDPDAGALKGIAVTGLGTGNGAWEYTTAFDPTLPTLGWAPIPTVSGATALLLAADADTRVRIRPNAGFKPTFLGLTFRAWDRADGAAEGTLQDPGDARPGSAFSAAADRAWVAIGKVAPVVDPDGATVLPVPLPVYKDTSKVVPLKPVKAQDLLGIAGLEAGETVTSLKKATHGVAITGADRADGTWQYSATGKATDWHDVPADVSEATALLLGPTYRLRFVPGGRGADGPARLTFRAWAPAADVTLQAGDVNVDTSAHAGAFGADPGTAVLDLAPRLHLSRPAILNPVDAGQPTNAVALADLLDPFRVVGDNVGAAVVGAAGPGSWQFSADGGNTWTGFPAKPAVSVGQALLLPLDAQVRFVAATDTPGKKPLAPATARLSVKAWDLTVASAGQRAAAKGSAFSTETEVVTAAFRNHAPSLAAGAPALKPVSASARPGTGSAVSALLANKVYLDTDRPATPPGVAVTGLTGAGGRWQYSLGGNVWADFGAVGDTSAVLLATGNRLRFLVTDAAVAANTQATLTFRAWDQSAGRAGDVGVDTTLAGGLNSFSTGTPDTATLNVVA